MKILAILTGRGGSILKDKNVLPVLKKPVLGYPSEEAKKVKEIEYFFVSSDDKKILNTAERYGYKKIIRPKKYSRSNSKHHDVLKHALNKLKSKKILPDIIIVLLANAPIIKSKWIRDSIKMILNTDATAVVPVIQDNDKHPLRAKKLSGRYLKPFINSKRKISSNRQDLDECYFLCHNFWVIKTKEIYKNNGYAPWNFMGKRVLPYIIKSSHDIHKKIDIHICEQILKDEKLI